MENEMTRGDLVRMVGLMAVGVGIAWAVQILGLSHGGATIGRLFWLLGGASVCGAGLGLVVTSGTMAERAAIRIKS